MRVVLVNPSSPFMINQAVMPPLGLWYVANSIDNAIVVDMGLGDTIPTGADVYGITGTSANVKEIEQVLRSLDGEHGLKVAGGPHATALPNDMLEMGFDTVVHGEGEETFGLVISNNLTGIVSSPRIKDIDNFFPDRRQENRYSYSIDGIPASTMVTSRGCPWDCAFCSKEVYGNKRVTRSVESVMIEVDSVMSDGYGAIMFYDDTFMTGRNRLEALCHEFKSRNLVWRCLARSDDADRNILQLMRESGCREIGVGVETGSQIISDNIHKHETVEQQKRCIQLAHEVGMRVKAFMIVGLPGESWDTIGETDKFLEETRPDALDVSILAVYPGSAIYRDPSNYDIEFGPFVHFKGREGSYSCNVSTSHMTSEEIMQAHDMLYRKYC